MTKEDRLFWRIWKPVVIDHSCCNHHCLSPVIQIVLNDARQMDVQGNEDARRYEGDGCVRVPSPVFLYHRVKRDNFCGRVIKFDGSLMDDDFCLARGDVAAVDDRNKCSLVLKVISGGTQCQISSFRYMQSSSSRLGGILGGTGLNHGLCGDSFRLVGLVLHSIGQVFSSVSLIFHLISEVLHPVSLCACSDGKIVSVPPGFVHLPPLQAYEYGGESGHEHSNFSPSQGASFKASHLALYLLRSASGFRLCVRPVWWSEYLGRKGHTGFLSKAE